LGSFIESNLFENGDINTKKFTHALFSEFEKQGKKSPIYKQVMKQTHPKFKKMEFWADIYASMLDYSIEQENITQNELLKILNNIKGLETVKKINISEEVYLAGISLTIPLQDMYTLSRLLKQPDNGERPSLMFGFFGDEHVSNIIHILKTKMDYEEVHKISFRLGGSTYSKIDRCMKFDFSLDLTEEVKRHNREIDKASETMKFSFKKSKKYPKSKKNC
jgi:hypothetical protein